MTDLYVEGTNFSFDDIIINTIEPIDIDCRYIFVLSCHGAELDNERNVILNEGCYFESIGFGNRYGHLAYTDAHQQKAIPLHESNVGNDIINELSSVNINFRNDQETNNETYYINNLSTESLPNARETINNRETFYSSLNPMSFLIKKSDYDGYNKDKKSIEFKQSEVYMNAFGLWLYKCYKFKAKLNERNRNRTIDLDIATNRQQLKGFYNRAKIHEYFSNTKNRSKDTLSPENKELIKNDIRSYMEPDQKCTWNTVINMCYDTLADLQTTIPNIYNEKWHLRVLCCRSTPRGVDSSTTPFIENRDIINYVPELIDDTRNDTFVPFISNLNSIEHINDIFNNLLVYLNRNYDAFRCIAKTNNKNVHFITSHHQLLLVFQLLAVIYPVIINNPDEAYNQNINFRKLLFRIHTITIENSQYDLFDALLTLTANRNQGSKRYSRKKISLLGNPTNKRLYMEELLNKLNIVINNQDGNTVGIQGNLRNYLNEALNNGGNSEDYPNEKYIIDNIIMLTKIKNFMDDYNENISIINESDDDAMALEENDENDYLAFNFDDTEQRDINDLIDNTQYLGLIGDDIFNNAYAQYSKFIYGESNNFDSHICMYFTAAKEVNEENEKIEEAVFVFILDISDAFTNVVSYLIGLNNDSFMNSEEFRGVVWREDYSERILNYKKGVMFQENYEHPDNIDIKILINYFLYHGCIIPLYRNGFNYIDLIYRDRDTMTGGGPKTKIPKQRTFDPTDPPTIDLDLDKLSDKNQTVEPKYKLKEDIPEFQNLKRVNFKKTFQRDENFVGNDDVEKLPEFQNLKRVKKKTFQRDENFVGNDDIEKLPVNPDSIFPLNLIEGYSKPKPVNEVGSPPREAKSPLQVNTPGSDVILGSKLPDSDEPVAIAPAFNYGSPGRNPIRLPGSPQRSKSDSDILRRDLEINIPPLKFEEEQISSSKSEPLFKTSMSKSPSVSEMEALGKLPPSKSESGYLVGDYLVGQDVEDVEDVKDVGEDVQGEDMELEGGRKKNSKKRKVKKNGKTKKKRVKKRNAKKNK